jgi:hypothetical protein
MKALIFDSGPLINLSMNGLLFTLEELKKNFDGKFLITEAVKREVVDRPMNIDKFELGALRIQRLLTKGVLEMASSVGVDEAWLKNETEKLMIAANGAVRFKSIAIKIVSDAEMSCLALSSFLNKKAVENLIVIDERTTRMLVENAQNLERLMSEKLHRAVKVDLHNLKDLARHKFIRTSELVYVAYKAGVTQLEGKKVLDALVYATKFKGASISFSEINELRKM